MSVIAQGTSWSDLLDRMHQIDASLVAGTVYELRIVPADGAVFPGQDALDALYRAGTEQGVHWVGSPYVDSATGELVLRAVDQSPFLVPIISILLTLIRVLGPFLMTAMWAFLIGAVAWKVTEVPAVEVFSTMQWVMVGTFVLAAYFVISGGSVRTENYAIRAGQG